MLLILEEGYKKKHSIVREEFYDTLKRIKKNSHLNNSDFEAF